MTHPLQEIFDQVSLLHEFLELHSTRLPNKVAMIYEDRQTTYAEMEERANKQANKMLEAGIKAGDRIAILAKNIDRFFELNFATMKIGAVLVPVNFRLAPPEVAFVVNDARARFLFVGDDFYGLVEKIEDQLEHTDHIVGLHDNHPRWAGFLEWYKDASADRPDIAISGDDVAMQLYSSGTTGHPKGVELSHNNLLVLLPDAMTNWGKWEEDDVSIVAMPLFHIAGCEWGMLAFAAGATNIVMPEVDPGKILHDIETFKVTQALFVPAVILSLIQHPNCATTDFSSLKTVIYGASPIPFEVQQKAVALFGCDFAQVYGLTETTGAVTYLPPEAHDGTTRMKSCGKAMATAEIRTIREDGNDCDPGEVGEILIKSGQVMKGYWNRPEATAEAIRDGWFYSGDAGYLDEEGYLYIHDRVKDMIVSGGENIYPAEVESALFGHPAIADIAVIGVPDDKWGESVKAVIVLNDGHALSEDDFIAYARDQIAGYKVPRSIDFMDELPRNPSGKILKRELRKPYWQGKERAVN